VAVRPRCSELSVVLLVCATAAVGAQAYTRPAWSYAASDSVRWHGLTPLGSIAVLTSNGLVVLEQNTGKPIWTRSDVQALSLIDDSARVVLYSSSGHEVADLLTGATVWRFSDLPLATPRHFFEDPNRRTLVVYGSSEQGRLKVVAVSLDSGRVVWTQEELFTHMPALDSRSGTITLASESWQPPLWDSDSTVILCPNVGGPIKLHRASGALVWRADMPDRRLPGAVEDGFAPILAAAGKVFVPYGKRLMALDAHTGRLVWDRAEDFLVPVAQMELAPQGLVVLGAPRRGEAGGRDGHPPFLQVLDPESGDAVWPKPLRRLHATTEFHVRNDTAYLATHKALLAVDLASGTARRIAKVRLRGGETPRQIELVPAGFLVISRQSLRLFDSMGVEQYDAYYPAPGASYSEQFTTLATLLGAAAVAALPNTPYLVPPGDVAQGLTRYHASQYTKDYVYMLTGLGGLSVVKIGKANGREVGHVWIDNGIPQYRVDPGEGKAYFVRNGREIVAFGL